jgi:hypothetical protein
MTSTRTNTTRHVLVSFDDGETLGEQHRDSLGGWRQLMQRMAERNGRSAEDVRPVLDAFGDLAGWTVAGRRFTVATMEVL